MLPRRFPINLDTNDPMYIETGGGYSPVGGGSSPEQGSQLWTILGEVASDGVISIVQGAFGQPITGSVVTPSADSGSPSSDNNPGAGQNTKNPDWGIYAAIGAAIVLAIALVILFKRKKKNG